MWVGLYPGTYDGCDCLHAIPSSSKKVENKIYTSSCNYNQTIQLCKDIYPTAKVSLKEWPQGSRFCAKRIKGSNFKANFDKFDFKKGACKKGFKLCSN